MTDVRDCVKELDREEFRYVVPDFRLNKVLTECGLTEAQKAAIAAAQAKKAAAAKAAVEGKA